VNEVCKPGEALAAAKKIAAQILECSPMSIRASKEAVYRGLTEASLETAIDGQRKNEGIRAMFTSEDLIEGPMAFAQKRPPQWKGR
jgi:crotonobetainyl-CoA hydratase